MREKKQEPEKKVYTLDSIGSAGVSWALTGSCCSCCSEQQSVARSVKGSVEGSVKRLSRAPPLLRYRLLDLLLLPLCLSAVCDQV